MAIAATINIERGNLLADVAKLALFFFISHLSTGDFDS